MKVLDKLRNTVKINKKITSFLFIIAIIGIIFGAIYTIILSKTDKQLVTEYLDNFISQIKDNKLDYMSALISTIVSNLSFIIIIWLLGISVIGIPVSLFMFFTKTFILGFSITSIIYRYKLVGALYSLIYIFPHQIINLIIYIILMLYSLSLSLKLIYSIFKKKTIDFKLVMNKYTLVLIISIVSIIITSLIEVYIFPNIIKLILPILK